MMKRDIRQAAYLAYRLSFHGCMRIARLECDPFADKNHDERALFNLSVYVLTGHRTAELFALDQSQISAVRITTLLFHLFSRASGGGLNIFKTLPGPQVLLSIQ